MEKVLFLLLLLVVAGGAAIFRDDGGGQKAAFKLPATWFQTWSPPPRNFETRQLLPPSSVSRFPILYPSVIRAHTSPLLQGPQTDQPGIPSSSQLGTVEVSSPHNQGTTSQKVFSSAPQQLISPTLHLFSPVIMQQRSQDELGGYHFSYSGGPTSRTETRDHAGVVRGAYSYIDPNGEHQEYQYIADKGGYRVTRVEGEASGTRASSLGMGSSIFVPSGVIRQDTAPSYEGVPPTLRILRIPELIIARKAKSLDAESSIEDN